MQSGTSNFEKITAADRTCANLNHTTGTNFSFASTYSEK